MNGGALGDSQGTSNFAILMSLEMLYEYEKAPYTPWTVDQDKPSSRSLAHALHSTKVRWKGPYFVPKIPMGRTII